ncbi:sensor histidine kinase [Mesorhizobium sp. M1423]|uniref:sensor histidine kinase n=1 Tax=Mesorhizobium sp. M1423 TaxID=2957101 RepID=UPI003336AC64
MLSIERAVDEGVPAAAAYRVSIALDALKRLVGELTDIARLSQMNASLTPKRRFYAEVCGIDLQVGTSELFVQTDPDMLHSIIRNLVWNALKYCGPGGYGRVSCRPDRNRVRIEVEDDGCGIPAARLDGIFNVFERDEQAGRSDGLGLGLTIVRQPANLPRHPICVRSVENEGSVFSVELPLHVSEMAC